MANDNACKSLVSHVALGSELKSSPYPLPGLAQVDVADVWAPAGDEATLTAAIELADKTMAEMSFCFTPRI
jgi:hypothetical protein